MALKFLPVLISAFIIPVFSQRSYYPSQLDTKLELSDAYWEEYINSIMRRTEKSKFIINEELDKFDKEMLEDIIAGEATDEDSFDRVCIPTEWVPDSDVFNCSTKDCDRWLSASEFFMLEQGDCEDGAIAFKVLLSDDPDYEVKLIWVVGEFETGHMIAVYKYKGLWGYVSFNVPYIDRHCDMVPPYMHTYEEVLKDCWYHYDYYTEVDIPLYELKYGQNIEGLVNRVWKNVGKGKFRRVKK